MEYKYEGNSLKSGIYKITNKLNGRIYIGSAKLFKVRWSQHSSSLRNQKHSNKFLQADFNKSGEEAFVFEVIEVTEGKAKEERLLIEEGYLKQYFDSGNNCYNLCDRAISREGYSSNTPEKTKALMSAITKQRWQDPEIRAALSQKISESSKGKVKSDTHRNNISKGQKGKQLGPQTPEHIAKRTEKLRGKLFSEEHKQKLSLAKQGIYDGAANPFYGKQHTEASKKRMSGPRNKKTINSEVGVKSIRTKNKEVVKTNLISPKGVLYTEIIDLTEFCKEHHLILQHLLGVIHGKANHHRAWRLNKQALKPMPNVRLLSPDGTIYEHIRIVGFTDFAKTHGLSVAGLRFLLSGQRKTHKGWRRADDPVVEIEMDHRAKQCSQCHEEKSLSLFNNKAESKDGKRANCRDCQKKAYKKSS
jgi:group I intron endonuclease